MGPIWVRVPFRSISTLDFAERRMTKINEAKKKLKHWRKQYQKEYKFYRSSWQYSVVFAANNCRIWKEEIERLESKHG